MLPYIILLLSFLVFSGSAILSFSKSFSESNFFIPTTLILGLCSTTLWICLVRTINNPQKLFWWSLAWDLLMLLAFYLLPILIGSVKLNSSISFGLILILLGIMLVKASS